jgi:hypothetical protein|tara:strand:- start:3512 stop:3622 length:111 start_codon:yes stop_codon:yes gene_type:complete
MIIKGSAKATKTEKARYINAFQKRNILKTFGASTVS